MNPIDVFKVLVVGVPITRSSIEGYIEVSLTKAFIVVKATSNDSPISIIDRSGVFPIDR